MNQPMNNGGHLGDMATGLAAHEAVQGHDSAHQPNLAGRPLITDPGRHDVLFGRGPQVYNHEGNKNFRQFLAEYKKEYTEASLPDKHKVAKKLAGIWCNSLNPPGRFLFPHTNAVDNRFWQEAGFTEACRKTSQWLRGKPTVRKTPQDVSGGGPLQGSDEAQARYQGSIQASPQERLVFTFAAAVSNVQDDDDDDVLVLGTKPSTPASSDDERPSLAPTFTWEAHVYGARLSPATTADKYEAEDSKMPARLSPDINSATLDSLLAAAHNREASVVDCAASTDKAAATAGSALLASSDDEEDDSWTQGCHNAAKMFPGITLDHVLDESLEGEDEDHPKHSPQA
jgi:hypothetical protein